MTVLDNTDGSDNCSYGNAGYFSPSHIIPLAAPGVMTKGLKWMLDKESPFYIKPRLNKDLISWGYLFNKAATTKKVKTAAPLLHELMMISRRLIEELLAEEKIDAGLNTQGLIMYCKTRGMLNEEEEVGQWAKALGQSVETISPQEALELNPGMDLNIYGGVYFKDDACVTPHLLMQGLKEKLLAKGVEIRLNQHVESISHSNGSIKEVCVQDNAIQADEYIVAAGSWTPQLLGKIGVNVPIQPGKGYSFVLEQPVVMPQIPGILAEAKIAMTPMLHGLRFAGTMELAGLDKTINPIRVKAIAKSIPKYFPQFEPDHFARIEPWSGLRPCSPDGLPYIGKTNTYSNLLVASGHAMLGLSLAPVTGKLIADLAVGDSPGLDLSLLDVERYG